MKRFCGIFALFSILAIPFQSFSATLYVDLNSAAPTPPYADWSTAATNIQDAVDAAVAGDLILVTNGVYATGARTYYGTPTNRVVIDKAVTVQSVGGPLVTVIEGLQDTNRYASTGIRCVAMTNTAELIGFTLTNGRTPYLNPDSQGGGVWGVYYPEQGLVSNCIITSCSADDGGGAAHVKLQNCIIRNNQVNLYGGGAYGCELNSCVVASNRAWFQVGGTYGCFLNNGLVVGNSSVNASAAVYDGPVFVPTCANCTIVGNNGGGVEGGLVVNSIVYDNYYGSITQYNYKSSSYISNSCIFPLPTFGPVNNNISNAPAFVDPVNGDYHLALASHCVDAGNNAYVTTSTDLDGNPRILGTVDMGAYEFPVHYPIHYVSLSSTNPLWPYIDWNIAATNIQDAVDSAISGDSVVVSNGVYQNGGRVIYGAMTNRVAITRPITLRSLNGPDLTFIQGFQLPGTTNGDGAVRCVYLSNNVVLVGFTLTNGATRSTGDEVKEQSGGGVLAQSSSAVISNCVLAANSAMEGGGAQDGTLYNSILTGNSAFNLGGGGARSSILNGCVLISNQTSGIGAGALYCTLNNCFLVRNAARLQGGGACWCALNSCTVVANSALLGGGLWGGSCTNSIVYFNTVVHSGGTNYGAVSWWNGCCTLPMPPSSWDTITNAPLFVDFASMDFHLQSGSPCINSGKNAFAPPGPDFDGNPRISGGTIDIGAYEFQNPASSISYAWLLGYGLPLDGSADFLDADNDGMSTWQEWRAGTSPLDSSSVLQMLSLSVINSSVIVSWQSSPLKTYSLQRSSLSLGEPFSTVQSNIQGQVGTTSFADTNLAGANAWIYRVLLE
jgi:hypothetical protein